MVHIIPAPTSPLLSLRTSAAEAHATQQEKPPQWEACTPQREKAHAAMKTQHSQKF